MTEFQNFIDQCLVKVEVNLPNGEKKKGSFGSRYITELIEKGTTLKDFLIEAQSNFKE